MRGFLVLILICLFFVPCAAEAALETRTTTLENTEKLLLKAPEDKNLLTMAQKNSIDTQNWDKAIYYTDKLLVLEPDSENLLKIKGDAYSIKKDFPNAIKSYQTLVQNYPRLEYSLVLTDLYAANQDFANAQAVIEPVYNANLNDKIVVNIYLNLLLAQGKTRQAYWVIKTHHLEETVEGYTILGDMAMLDKDYKTADKNYYCALKLEPENLILQNKLTQFNHFIKNVNNNLLDSDIEKNPNSLETELGAESLNMAKNRVIFYDLLNINPNYVPTKAGLTRSYIGTTHDLSNLEKLKKMPQNDKNKFLKAKAYYNMNMWSDAKEVLEGVETKEAKELKYRIRRDEAITLTPSYSFFFQQLADEFDLDIHQFGTRLSKNVDNNKNVFAEYNVLTYTSGHIGSTTNRLTNVVNEFKGGIRARANEKWEYRGDIGVKAFEFGDGAMIITDSWIKHYFNDKLNLKLGFRRDNIEQSYLSAVGRMVNGVFTGRAADNKLYLEFNRLLPHGLYTFGFGSCGVVDAQNLPTNQYSEGLVGLGKLLYNNPKSNWLTSFGVDIVSYNSTYQFNLLKIYNNAGHAFGGYFSPSYFNATTFNVRAEGCLKKCHLKYGIDGFGGIQTAMSPDMTVPAWGVAPYIAYDINDNVAINLAYDHYVYAGIQRDQFIINAVIRGFKKHAKN